MLGPSLSFTISSPCKIHPSILFAVQTGSPHAIEFLEVYLRSKQKSSVMESMTADRTCSPLPRHVLRKSAIG